MLRNRRRREWLRWAAIGGAALLAQRPLRASPYPMTLAAMREAQAAELGVHQRYTAYARKAQQEGYHGIAYLFAAFAAAEAIHAANFGRVLVRLGGEVSRVPPPEATSSSTRENLLAAMTIEARSVDEVYPQLLERIKPEGVEDAMAAVRYAWATEKQHREKIRQIQRWSPSFFETVAKAIDAKTGSYYVCQNCGNTVNKVPQPACTVCNQAASSFKRIEPPA